MSTATDRNPGWAPADASEARRQSAAIVEADEGTCPNCGHGGRSRAYKIDYSWGDHVAPYGTTYGVRCICGASRIAKAKGGAE